MQNFFTTHLFNSVTRCLQELSKLQRKIQNEDSSFPDNLSEMNGDEYFKSNREIAAFFGFSKASLLVYKKAGILTSYLVNGASWFKISEVMDAVKIHPFLQNYLDRKATSSKFYTPEFKTNIHHFDKSLMFIYLSYQGWHCTIASIVALSSDDIDALCRKVIRLRHKIHPFPISPN